MPNRTVPVIVVPANALPAKNQSGALLSLASMALTHGLEPVFVDTAGLTRKSVFVPPVIDARIEEFAADRNWSYPDAFAALCAAALSVLLQNRASMAADSNQVEVPFAARPGQDRYYKSMMASINKGRVCLAEASTGIGKSRSMVAAAITAALGGKKPVVIAAPTLAILGGSLWKEYETLRQEGLGVQCKVRFFPGASEYVDYDRLVGYLKEAALLDEPFDAAVQAWVEDGCPVLNETPLTRAMSKAGRTLRFLMSDLRGLATNLDPAEFVYRRSDSDNEPIQALLEAIREDAVDADIIFCTHAMLTSAKLGAWEWFPKPNVLFVDEAHLLEGIVASVTSTNLSLFSLRHSARVMRTEQGLGSNSAAGRLEACLRELIDAAQTLDSGGYGIRLGSNLATTPAFVVALAKTTEVLNSRGLAQLPRVKEARACLSMVAAAIAATPNAFGRIEFSPDRRFPSLLAGSRSVNGLLGAIWHDAAGGIALASASLSTPDEFGNSKFDYIAQLLALPISRLDTPTPITAPWLTSIPVVHIPAEPALLARPAAASRTGGAESQWLGTLAEQLLYVTDLAKGGTLVLMTSYAQIHALAEMLAAFGVTERLVVQSPDEKFQLCEQRFRAAYAKGVRPVLLGLGVAWTGVDLTDKSVPEQYDFLMTDLVVGCLPVGLNRSSTMAARVDARGLDPVIKEALMTLLQGLGRCVRSEHAVDKNMWLMDGRLWTDWPGMQSLQRSARRVIERYAHRVTFG